VNAPASPLRDYFAIDAVSQSMLKDLDESPAYFKAVHIDRVVARKQTEAMRLGTMLHCAVLEPEIFESRYVVWSGDRRTKAGKEDHAAIVASGAEIIDHDELAQIRGMAAAILAHPGASKLLALCPLREHVIEWTDEASGVRCKAKLDLATPGLVVDLKSAISSNPKAFAKQAANLGMHIQDRHYTAGWSAVNGGMRTDFAFIVVGKEAPHLVSTVQLGPVSQMKGAEKRAELLELYRTCRDSGEWPGYGDHIQTIELPSWAA
jgi:hypothetical protein